MNNKRSFIDELNAVSKPREEANIHQENAKTREAISKARQDYEGIKTKLLNSASQDGYDQYGKTKVVTCMQTPAYPFNFYRQEGGVQVRRTIFGNVKSSMSSSIKFIPHDSSAWNAYVSELKRLGSQDNVSIRPVLYDTICKRIIGDFPITVYNPKPGQYCCVDIQLECTVTF